MSGGKFFSKILVFALVIVLATPLFISAAENVSDKELVRVGVYDNKPKIYRDGNGEMQGFWADILEYVAGQEGWEIEYVYGTWNEGLERLENNEIDIMVDVALSEERQAIYDFTNETALVNWGMIYTQPDSGIETIQDLEGKDIAVMKSGIHFTGPWGIKNMLDSFQIEVNYLDVGVYDDVFELLDKKEADAGVVNRIFGIYNEDDYDVERTNIVFNPIELRFALPKGAEKNADLVEALDSNLIDLKEEKNSIYHEALQTYLMGTQEEIIVFPVWAKTAIIISIVIIAALIFVYIISRRYQGKLERTVAERTKDLKESEEKYKNLYESSNDAIMLADYDRFIDCNKATLEMFGVKSVQDFIKLTPVDLSPPEQPSGQDSASLSKKKLDEAYEKGSSRFHWVHRNMEGKDFDTDILLTKVNYEGKDIVLATIRDISEKTKAEAKVKELNELRQKFVQIVSHQLRTPLTSCRWNMENLLRGELGKLDEAQEKTLRAAYRAQSTVIDRLGNLLTIVDIEEGRAGLSTENISLESLWGTVMKEAKKQCQAKNIDFIYHSPSELLPKVTVDREKIRDVFCQLVNNAIDYTPENGKIETRFINKDGIIRFEVKDSGVGIPKVEQPRIFSKFFRASNASSMATDRSGIGLSIAKHYIEKHGGKIGFNSREGKGSTFWFEIPVSPQND